MVQVVRVAWVVRESESKVINQIFGHLQHPKNEVSYLQNRHFELQKRFFSYKGVFFTQVIKGKFETRFIYDPLPFTESLLIFV